MPVDVNKVHPPALQSSPLTGAEARPPIRSRLMETIPSRSLTGTSSGLDLSLWNYGLALEP